MSLPLRAPAAPAAMHASHTMPMHMPAAAVASNGAVYAPHDAGAPGPSAVPAPPSASTDAAAARTAARTAADLMRVGPRDFDVIRPLGDGSFGTVFLANWKSPLPDDMVLSTMHHTRASEFKGKRLVAIKRMKKPYADWHDCLRLRELRSLLEIPHHPNIVALYDAFLMPGTSQLHFVFESLEGNLFQLTKVRKGRALAGGLVASIFRQTLEGLAHIHAHGFFHRDMKPENLLLTTLGLENYPNPTRPGRFEQDVSVVVKIADFGLARELSSSPPYSTYVSTRWYRAPEMLLHSTSYSAPVDIWALGAIMTEVINLDPLFPGVNEPAQLMLISETLGSPSNEWGVDARTGKSVGGGPWPEGERLMEQNGLLWPRCPPVQFSTLFGTKIPTNLIALIQELLRYDPAARPTAAECLRFPYILEDAVKLQPPPPAPQRASPSVPPPGTAGSTSTAGSSAVSSITPPSLTHPGQTTSSSSSLHPAVPALASTGPAPVVASEWGAAPKPSDPSKPAHPPAAPGYVSSVGTGSTINTVHDQSHLSYGQQAAHAMAPSASHASQASSLRLTSEPSGGYPASFHSSAASARGDAPSYAASTVSDRDIKKDKAPAQGRARALLTRRNVGLRSIDPKGPPPAPVAAPLSHINENPGPRGSGRPDALQYVDPSLAGGIQSPHPHWQSQQPVQEVLAGFNSPTTGEFPFGSSSPALSTSSAVSGAGASLAFASAGAALAPAPAPYDALGGHAPHLSYPDHRPQHAVRDSIASVQTGRSDPLPTYGAGTGDPNMSQASLQAGAQWRQAGSHDTHTLPIHLGVRAPRTGTALSAGSASSFDRASVQSHYSRFSTLSGPQASLGAPTRMRARGKAPSTQGSVDSQLLNDLSNLLGTDVSVSPAINPRPHNASRAADSGRRSQGRSRSRGVSLSSRTGGGPSSPLPPHPQHRLHPYRSSSRPLSNPSSTTLASPTPGLTLPARSPRAADVPAQSSLGPEVGPPPALPSLGPEQTLVSSPADILSSPQQAFEGVSSLPTPELSPAPLLMHPGSQGFPWPQPQTWNQEMGQGDKAFYAPHGAGHTLQPHPQAHPQGAHAGAPRMQFAPMQLHPHPSLAHAPAHTQAQVQAQAQAQVSGAAPSAGAPLPLGAGGMHTHTHMHMHTPTHDAPTLGPTSSSADLYAHPPSFSEHVS